MVFQQFFQFAEPFGEPSIYTQTLLDIINNQKILLEKIEVET